MMATSVWYLLVTMLFCYVVGVASRDCSDDPGKPVHTSCDECIRCGGQWCQKPTDWSSRCVLGSSDSCGDLWAPSPLDSTAVFVQSNQEKRIIVLNTTDKYEIHPISSTIFNLTGLEDIISRTKTRITARPSVNFCPIESEMEEQVTIQIENMNKPSESQIVTIAVPCMCECSKAVEENSSKCNKRGNYSCEVCTCQKGWKGQYCEVEEVLPPVVPPEISPPSPPGVPQFPVPPIVLPPIGPTVPSKDTTQRGDVPDSCKNKYSNDTCSGNGECIGEKCVCNKSREGSQYFVPGDNSLIPCADICMSISVSGSDACVTDQELPLGVCKHDKSYYKHEWNVTWFDEVNDSGKKKWINCSLKKDNCVIIYGAMQSNATPEYTTTHIMIDTTQPCKEVADPQTAVRVGLPVGLLIAVLAAIVLGTFGYMAWKKGQPPVHLNEPGYGAIDPEDCVGQNPLFKPAISSYTNPTYGRKE